MQNAIIVPSSEKALNELNNIYKEKYIINGYTDTIEEALEAIEDENTIILTDIVTDNKDKRIIYVGPDIIYLEDTKSRGLKNLKDSIVFVGNIEDGKISEGSIVTLRSGYKKYLEALSGGENIFEPLEKTSPEAENEEIDEITNNESDTDEKLKNEPLEDELTGGLEEESVSVKTNVGFEEPEIVESDYNKINFYFKREENKVEAHDIERPTEILEELEKQRETQKEKNAQKPVIEEVKREEIAIKPPIEMLNKNDSIEVENDEEDVYIGKAPEVQTKEEKKGFISTLKGWFSKK